jgi:hypothetical protein
MKLTKKQLEGITLPPLTQGNRNGSAMSKKRKKKQVPDQQFALFDAACKAHGLPEPVHEYEFHPTRKWRLDHVFDGWLAVEVQGGLFVAGRHVQGAALLAEYEKLNEAAIAGFTVLFVTPRQIDTGEAFAIIKRALETEA